MPSTFRNQEKWLGIDRFFSVFVWVHSVCTGWLAYASTWGGQRSTSGIFLWSAPPCFKAGLSLNLQLISWLNRLAVKAEDLPVYLLSAEITDAQDCTGLQCGCLGLNNMVLQQVCYRLSHRPGPLSWFVPVKRVTDQDGRSWLIWIRVWD